MNSIATALTHARQKRLPVDVLVDGHWLRGGVALIDGFGVVVLDLDTSGQSVVRIESISAVTVGAEAPAAPHLVPQRAMAVAR